MSHRVTEKWMGEQVETLEDLLRPGLHAVCIGINPAPASVSAGHYYQGKLGQMFYGASGEQGFYGVRPGGKTT
jgi:TDG/mug DNA glycosylase family protein